MSGMENMQASSKLNEGDLIMKKLLTAVTATTMLATPALAKQSFEFWTISYGALFEATEKACKDFNASQSKYEVKCSMQGYAVMNKAIAAYRAKNHPALILGFETDTTDLLMSGAVVPVNKISPKADWNSYPKSVQAYYADSKGKLWGQPYTGSTLAFYGNKKKLAAVGVKELPKTWEEFEVVAQKLKANGEKCILTSDMHAWRILEQFISRHNVAIATQGNGYKGLDAKYKLTGGLVEKHMANYVKWRKAGMLSMNEDTKQGKYTKAFNAGDCALMEASIGSYAGMYKAQGDNLLFGKPMMYKGYKRHNQFIGGAAIWALDGHEGVQDGVQAFLDFLRKPQYQKLVTGKTGYIPMTSAGLKYLEDAGLTKDPQYATAKLAFDLLNAPAGENTKGIRLGFYGQFRKAFQTEIKKAAMGEQTAKQALVNAEKEGNKLLSRFAQINTGKKLP